MGFRLILNSTEPDKYLVGEKKIVYSSRDFELHCAEIEFIDDDVLQGNVELGISIESDSNYTVSTNHMTITVLDNGMYLFIITYSSSLLFYKLFQMLK